MRIWIVNIGRVSKTFQTEESFNSWISDIGYDTTDADSKAVVTIYDASPIETKTVKEIKDSIKESNIRESRIQAVVSDDPWFSKFENFKNELGKYPNTQPIIEKLNMLSSEQKPITKYLKAQKELLIYYSSTDYIIVKIK